MSENGVRHFLKASEADRWHALFTLLLATGLRPSEARNILHRHFRKVLKAGELDQKLRLYDLRHTHATLLLLAGTHPKIVSERIGHSSVSITLDTYRVTCRRPCNARAPRRWTGCCSGRLERRLSGR